MEASDLSFRCWLAFSGQGGRLARAGGQESPSRESSETAMRSIALTIKAQGGRVLETRQGPRGPASSRGAFVLTFGKFALVGGLGALVNTGALIGLYSYLRLPLVAASALGTEAAIAHNFLW